MNNIEFIICAVENRMKMTDQTEKRTHNRHDQEAIIIWSYFNATIFNYAKLINYSRSGLCFESECKLRPGAGIYIRLEKLLPNLSGAKQHEGLRTVTLGEAKWCIETGFQESHRFITGVQYYEPDY